MCTVFAFLHQFKTRFSPFTPLLRQGYSFSHPKNCIWENEKLSPQQQEEQQQQRFPLPDLSAAPQIKTQQYRKELFHSSPLLLLEDEGDFHAEDLC